MNYTEAVAAALKGCVELPEEELFALLETPKNPSMGDIAFPCFKLSKLLRKAPNAIAAELKEKIVLPAGIERAEAVGPYLNFFIEKGQQAQTVLTKVLDAGKAYGGSDEGKGRHVVLDYSSINIAKPFGFHHLPSTAIGNALYRIYRHLGYDPVGVNHLGDWGTQFGKMIVAYKKWGEKPVDQYGIRELVDLYVRYHKEAEEHPEMDEEARAWFHRIETGDEEAVALWKQMKDATIREVKKTYARMGVQFDSWAGESFYEDKMEPVIRELKEKGISKLDKGATIVDLSEWNMPPCIILKSDGSTIYATRDLAASCYRKETYDFAKLLYVVAYQQDLHFKQIFKVLELMGRDWVKDCVHVNFGMVSMEGGAFHTREGKVLYLDDVLDAAVEKTYEIICEKSPDLEDKRSAAEAVGVGAVIWGALYNSRIKDVVFSYDKVLNFDGETGPYAQYTHARCCSVLRKAGGYDRGALDASVLSDPYSLALLKAIDGFPAAVKAAGEKYEPYLVARAVMAVCTAMNKFYYEVRIMADDEKERTARLALTDAVRAAISSAMAVTSFFVASASSRLPWPISMPIFLLMTLRWLRR